MALEVVWTKEALATFEQHFEYLLKEWTQKDAEKFLLQTNKVVDRLKLFPESYPPAKKTKSCRRARLNKNIALFYLYQKSKRTITLLTFWHVRQDQAKLKY